MSAKTYSTLSLYVVGAGMATTVVDAALVTYTPGLDGFLSGDPSERSVDRARIGFDPGTSTISYVRENSTTPNTLNTFTISPTYEFKPLVGAAVTRPSEARSLLYTSFIASSGTEIGDEDDYALTTPLPLTQLGFLGVRLFDSFGGNYYYGWVRFRNTGTNVTIFDITFDNQLNEPIIVPVPESSQTMAMLGGVLAAGLIGIRQLRKKKQPQPQVA